MAAKKNEVFTLPNEQIQVKFVKRQTGYIDNPKHIAYGGKLEGAKDILPVPMMRNGQLKNVLTDSEKVYLESMFGFDLSIYKNKDFWETLEVTLSKEGIRLDLSDPNDYIKYKILLSYDDMVAKTIQEKNDKISYKYVIVREGDETKLIKSSINIRKEAFKELGKLELSPIRMLGVLRVAGKRNLSSKTKEDSLIVLVGQLAEQDPERFLEIVRDEYLDLKIKLDQGIEAKVVVKEDNLYSLADGNPLAHSGVPATLMNAVKYLADPKNQDILLMIESKIK